jgi:hypothetical protein
MFRQKNVNQINSESGLCPPLCRDLLRPNFFNNLSVETHRPRPLRMVTAAVGPRLTSTRAAAMLNAVQVREVRKRFQCAPSVFFTGRIVQTPYHKSDVLLFL